MLSLLETGHGQNDPPSLPKTYKASKILQENTLLPMFFTLPCPIKAEKIICLPQKSIMLEHALWTLKQPFCFWACFSLYTCFHCILSCVKYEKLGIFQQNKLSVLTQHQYVKWLSYSKYSGLCSQILFYLSSSSHPITSCCALGNELVVSVEFQMGRSSPHWQIYLQQSQCW